MKILRSISLCAVASALLSTVAMAQSAAPKVRILSPVDASQLVTLKGNVNPHANAANDRGPVSASFALPDLTLVLSRSAEQQAAFDAFVASQYDPHSANYHQWLTANQIGAQFGPAQADIATITNWLAGQGFTVKSVSPDGMAIRFSGTAGTVQTAFHTSIHNLSVHGVSHYANMTNPQIPAALSPVVVGVKALHNFLPHPLHKTGSLVQFNTEKGKWQRIANPASGSITSTPSLSALGALPKTSFNAHPQYGINGSGTLSELLEEDVTPNDFATIYNVNPVWNAGFTGSGQTIAIAGTSLIQLSDVAAYRSEFGLPAGLTPIQTDTGMGPAAVACTGSTGYCSSGDQVENTLDVEVSGAVAPGAQVHLYVTGQIETGNNAGSVDSTYDSASYVVENHATVGANILSLSYGECELFQGTAENVAYYDLWQTAASEGISVFVASGDSGAAACDDGYDSEYGTPYIAQYGLSVNGMASTPFNTAVGGTDFSWCQPYYTVTGSGQNETLNVEGCASASSSQGSPAYWGTSNNSNGSSALGYVPEIPWNDSCENPIQARLYETLFSAGGSASADTALGINPTTPEETCNAIYKYWYQLDEGFGTTGFEDAVDAGSGAGSGGASGCISNNADTVTGNTIPTCTTGSTSVANSSGSPNPIPLVNNGWPAPTWQVSSGVPGTSGLTTRALPDVSFFAGAGALNSATLICASIDGSCTLTSGQENVYQEVGGTSVAAPEMAGVMALIDQDAGGAQGLANPELYQLAARQTYSSCSAESVSNTSANCYFQDIDNGPTAPSGPAYANAQTITMPCNLTGTTEGQSYSGTASPNCYAMSSGDILGSLGTSSTVAGYNSTTGFDMATGLGSLNVANVVNAWPVVLGSAKATVTVLPAVNTTNSNVALSVKVTVAGSSGTPVRNVTLTASGTTYSASGLLDNTGAYTFSIPANTFTASGLVTLTANYSGDAVYAAASNTATVTVAYIPVPTYSLAAIPAPAAISSPGGSATATVTVSSTTGYSGTVTLTCTLTQSPNGASDLPTCSGNPTVTLSGTTTTGTGSFTVTTTAASAALVYPAVGKGKGWLGAGGGAVLAFLVFLGVPARRKSWRAMLGMIVLLVALGSLSACGGGGSGGGGTVTTNPGTTTGSYTFTVSSSGSPSVSPAAASQTFTVTVN